MKKLILSSIFLGSFLFSAAQHYVDLFKLTYTDVPNVDINQAPSDPLKSSINQTKLLTSVPIKISDSLTFLTGIDYENHTTKLKNIWSASSMHITTLKLGLNVQHNSKLNGTYLLLPKLASDYGNFSNSFQIGAIALFKYQINPQTKFVFGNYINKELFGILNVPILGIYHKSVNEKFEADIKFPIVGYADYKLHKNLRIGADFLMIVRTFDLTQNLSSDFYAQLASNELGGYLQLDFLKESVIIKAKVIYAMFDYALYNDGKTTPFGTLGWYPGDSRRRMNGEYQNTLGFKLSAIYRFQL
jgi:hypothetical protein